jgi:hypothetical protein
VTTATLETEALAILADDTNMVVLDAMLPEI